MNEQHRMYYLDAMGIDMFVPRLRLPNALPSKMCVLPLSQQDVQRSTVQGSVTGFVAESVQNNSFKNSTESTQSILSVLDKKTTEHQPESQKIVEDLVTQKSSDAPIENARFSLGLWRVGSHLQVIDSGERGDALPTEALLRNILRVHKIIDSPMQLSRQEILNWPAGDDVDHDEDQSWNAAHELVLSFLEGRLLPKPVTLFWLMGNSASRSVLGHDFDFEGALFKTISVDAFTAEALILPSLRDILNTPILKRELWPCISSICKSFEK